MGANNPIFLGRSLGRPGFRSDFAPATRLRTEPKIGLIHRFPNDLHFAMFDFLIRISAFENFSGIAAWFSQFAAVTAAVPNICIVTH
jgi:hypothetical protein